MHMVLIFSGFVATLYPLVLLKAYNSDAIGDVWRILFVSFVHPIISEFLIMTLRTSLSDVTSADWNDLFMVQNQAQVYMAEFYLQLARRFM